MRRSGFITPITHCVWTQPASHRRKSRFCAACSLPERRETLLSNRPLPLFHLHLCCVNRVKRSALQSPQLFKKTGRVACFLNAEFMMGRLVYFPAGPATILCF